MTRRFGTLRLTRDVARRLLADATGATAMEYALIAALIVLAILSALKGLGLDLAGLPLQALIEAFQSVLA
jgi:Flp pilus assembly pilin Flp